MNDKRIIELWLQGHNKEWLVQQQTLEITDTAEVKNLKKSQIKVVAKKDIENALLAWWRKDKHDEEENGKGF